MSRTHVCSSADQENPVVVAVSGLQVCLQGTRTKVIEDVSFEVRAGELLGLVGESGSGKTTVAHTLLGYVRRGLEITGGTVCIEGHDMVSARPPRLQQMRGADVAYVPQDPASALNPALRVGTQLIEVLRAHRTSAKTFGDPAVRVAEALKEAGLDAVPQVLKSYPHQLSGGQQQRVGLAMAFLLRPKVIVLDEPTTGLDVTTQRHVLDTVRMLCASYGVAAIYVSHDLAVVGGLVTTVVVMYAGQVVENGPTDATFGAPAHPYTRKLLRAIPVLDRVAILEGIAGNPPRLVGRPLGCQFAARCDLTVAKCTRGPIALETVGPGHLARCIRTAENALALTGKRAQSGTSIARTSEAGDDPVLTVSNLSARYGNRQILTGVELTVARNQTLAVVGESGSGKTTLARSLVGLHSNWSGDVIFDGNSLAPAARSRPQQTLKNLQYIFQNPYTALNPRKTVRSIVEEPFVHFEPSSSRSERRDRVETALSDVALGADAWDRYPDQLSGGQRQRVAIARALIVEPVLLVCDEITSALDVSVQATIVELLRRLQKERGLSLVFITHNLALVRSIAQQAIVLSQGRVVESGLVAEIFDSPQDPYTVRLIQDAPQPQIRTEVT